MTPSVQHPSPPVAKDRLRPRTPAEASLPPADDSLVVVYGAGEYFAGTAD